MLMISIGAIVFFSISNDNYSYANTQNIVQPISKQILLDYFEEVERVQEKVNFIGKNAMRVKETNNTKGIQDYLLETKRLQDETIFLIKNIQRDYDTYKNKENSSILLSLILSLTDYRLALQELEYYLERDDVDKRYDSFIRFAVLKHRGDTIVDDVINIYK